MSEMHLLKKFSILLVALVFINGCITIVFEPSMGEDQRLTRSVAGQEDLTTHSGKDQKQ